MVEISPEDTPILVEVAHQHGIGIEDVEYLLSRHEVDAHLAEALLEVAVRRYRTLDRWGEKAEYERAVSEVLQRPWGASS